MAFIQQDVIDKAVILGNLDSGDTALMERVNVTAEMIITKASVYIGYDSLTVDTLLSILAEITVSQITRYQNLQGASGSSSGATKRITRGDYTVEYDTSGTQTSAVDVFNSYEWILKSFKKLRLL